MNTAPLPTTRRLGVLASLSWGSTFLASTLSAAGAVALVARGSVTSGLLVGALTVGGYGAAAGESRALTQRWAASRAHDQRTARHPSLRPLAPADVLVRLDAELEEWMREAGR